MSDQYGQRQIRNGITGPTPGPNRLLSDEAMEYVDQLAERQAAATTNPVLNGDDAKRRLHGG